MCPFRPPAARASHAARAPPRPPRPPTNAESRARAHARTHIIFVIANRRSPFPGGGTHPSVQPSIHPGAEGPAAPAFGARPASPLASGPAGRSERRAPSPQEEDDDDELLPNLHLEDEGYVYTGDHLGRRGGRPPRAPRLLGPLPLCPL
eukprot:scaffold741_cov303-Prasinococcus_capsulatus_cf.AAC.4